MLKSLIYDTFFRPLTSSWYMEVLKRLPDDARLLDVGIGTAGALGSNADLARKKRLRVTGIDIDRKYIERAKERIRQTCLSSQVEILLESVYDHQGGPYDAVYFSSSFMLLPDPVHALRHVAGLLGPDGKVYFTQTFQETHAPLLEKIKPMMGRFTSIEFGRVTYEHEFETTMEEAGMKLEELTVMKSIADKSFRLAVAVPAKQP